AEPLTSTLMTPRPLVLTAQALLFDMDGTLVDSTAVVERTWRRFARRYELDAEAVLATVHGRRARETVAAFAPAGTDVAAETARLVEEEIDDMAGVLPVPGAAALLAGLPPDSWALVTSAGHRLTTSRMAAAGLPVPSVLVTAETVHNGKPHPEGYLSAATALGVRPSAAIVFEDSDVGLRAAVASGARSVVVGDHQGPAAAGLTRIADFTRTTVHATTSANSTTTTTRLSLVLGTEGVEPGSPSAG
nr:HAD-IA family hydrolase [Micromonospora sp. DSM 115978]